MLMLFHLYKKKIVMKNVMKKQSSVRSGAEQIQPTPQASSWKSPAKSQKSTPRIVRPLNCNPICHVPIFPKTDAAYMYFADATRKSLFTEMKPTYKCHCWVRMTKFKAIKPGLPWRGIRPNTQRLITNCSQDFFTVFPGNMIRANAVAYISHFGAVRNSSI